MSVFRGGFKPVGAKLVSGDDGPRLEGTVRVETISIDDENSARICSRRTSSTSAQPRDRLPLDRGHGTADDLRDRRRALDGRVHLPVEARGRLRGPVDGSATGIERLALSLEANIDRTAFGMNWQMELPDGNQALANDVSLVVELEFQKS